MPPLDRDTRVKMLGPAYALGNKNRRFKNVGKFQPSIHKSVQKFTISVAFHAATMWNELPGDVRAAPTIGSFTSKLEAYLFNKTYPP